MPNFPVLRLDPDSDDFEEQNQLFAEFNKIKLRAQKRAIEDKMAQYYKKLIDEEQYEHFHHTSTCALKALHAEKTKADNIMDVKQGSNPYCFFTVNVKPEKATEGYLREFVEDLNSFMQRCKYFQETQYMYSIEQRSEGAEIMHGLHAHILFEKKDNAPSKLQRAFNNKFFDKWVATHAALDYKYISSDKLQSKIEYIAGIKEPGKMPKVEKDRKIKDAYGIPHFYVKGFEDFIARLKSGN